MAIKLRKECGVDQIFDPIRRKWLVETPEERVRVWFLNYLLETVGYNRGLIAVEYGFNLPSAKQLRADIVLFNPDATIKMIVECKAPNVALNGDTFSQATKYNSHFKAPYVLLTNGKQLCCYKTSDFIHYIPVEELPF